VLIDHLKSGHRAIARSDYWRRAKTRNPKIETRQTSDQAHAITQ
jgi:hypothetical protein